MIELIEAYVIVCIAVGFHNALYVHTLKALCVCVYVHVGFYLGEEVPPPKRFSFPSRQYVYNNMLTYSYIDFLALDKIRNDDCLCYQLSYGKPFLCQVNHCPVLGNVYLTKEIANNGITWLAKFNYFNH